MNVVYCFIAIPGNQPSCCFHGLKDVILSLVFRSIKRTTSEVVARKYWRNEPSGQLQIGDCRLSYPEKTLQLLGLLLNRLYGKKFITEW